MLVGLDIGSASAKAVAIDRRGEVLKVAERPHAPHDPDDWWRAAQDALDECGGHHCDGIGLSGMRGLVALDRDDAPVRPAILGGDTLSSVRDGEPDVYARIATILPPKDYVRLRLTRERATDVVDASGTRLFDVARREWSGDALGLDPAWLPPVYESPAPVGRLDGRIPVAAGAGDEGAAAVANGAVREGDPVSIVLGTSAVVVTPLDAYADGARCRCHAVPGGWAVIGVTPSAGGSLRWLRELLDPSASFRRLIAEADAWEPGAQGLRFAPRLEPDSRGAFAGLGTHHDRGALTRAVLEGVAFSVRASLGGRPAAVRVSGGGARSDTWLEILAAVLDAPLELCHAQEGAAYGAALLGGVAAGLWMDVPEAVSECVRVTRTIEPRADWVERYAELRPGHDDHGAE